MRCALSFLFFAIAAVVAVASPARADLSRPVHERRLANGLRVVVCPDPAGTDVSLVVRYDVGARDEPTYLEGLAHLVEHLMFTGSKHVPHGKLAELLEQAGATNVNGTTSADATVYQETLPPERLELGLWLESDRMGYLLDSLDEAAFRTARAEVLNEYRDRVTLVPLGAVPMFQRAELFPSWHPYHHLPVGTPESLGYIIRLADARAFAATWYGPENAVVVMAGKVDPPAALALAEKYFGSLPARPPPQRPELPALPRGATTYAHVSAGVTRAEARLAWITPAFGAPGDAELDVAAAILAGRGAGWLQRLLLGPSRPALSVDAHQQSMTLASVFEIRATVADDHQLKEVIDTIEQAIARFDTGVTDEELRRAKLIWHNARLFGLESSLTWATRLAAEAGFGRLPARFDGGLGTHAAITERAVRDAVRSWLSRRPAVVMLSHPARDFEQRGRLMETKETAP